MKTHQITLEKLNEWLPTAKMLYASSSAERKHLYVTASGEFEVMKDGDVVLRTKSDFEAVERYNDL